MTSIPAPSQFNIPFPSWRDIQLEVMEECLRSKKRFLVLDCPTGVGKSGIAIGLHHLMNMSRTVITTSTRYLQQQYNEVFGIPTMWGRSNYACSVLPDVPVDEGPCIVEKGCTKTSKWALCPYYRAKSIATSAPIVILNNSYFLHEANHVGGFSGANLLIFDEGHLLETSLMGFVGVRLTFKTLAKYTDKWKRELTDPRQLLKIAKEIRPAVAEEMSRIMSALTNTPEPEAIRALKHINAFNTNLNKICNTDLRSWVLNKDLAAFTLLPIMVNDVAEEYAFKHGQKILIMSATIGNGEIFGRQIGVRPNEMDFISARSPFLVPMRQVIFCPVVKLNYKSTEDDYDKLFAAINSILNKHSEQSGIIHCVSYKLRDRIIQGIAAEHKSRIITHGKEYMPREEAIAKFKKNVGSVLVSPSAEVGLDFPDDEARWCIWAKIPFADLRDKQVKARQKIDSEWYIWISTTTLIQGAGRIVRHEKDWGITYVLDKNMGWMLQYNRHLFPQWFLDAVHYRTLEQIIGKTSIDKISVGKISIGKISVDTEDDPKDVKKSEQGYESMRSGRDRGLFASSVYI